MASNTTELPGNDFFGKDFLGSVVKYGGLDRGSNTQAAKDATRLSAYEKALLQQKQSKSSNGGGGSAGGYQDLGGGNTVWRQAQPGMFTKPGTPGKKGWGQAIGSGIGAIAGTVLAPGVGTAMGARIGGGIGGGVDSYLYS